MVRPAAAPPGPGGFPIGRPFGIPFGSARTDAASYLLEAAARFGDVVRLRLPSGAGYLLSHPDAVKDVLVTRSHNFIKSRGLQRAKRLLGEGLLTSEGDHHARQRRLIQPTFHRERLRNYGGVMASFAQTAASRWRPGVQFDAAREMMHLTFAIVGKTLFGADVEAEADEVRGALTEVQQLLPASLLPLSELLDRVPLPANIRFWRARARLDAVIYRIIGARRASGDRGDLLSMLLAAGDGPDGSGMSDESVRDECMTLLLAGHETTANALTWTWFLLSRHPAVEAQLHSELDRVLAGRTPTFDDIAALPYAQMVVAESLRMYPPAWVIGRRAIAPFDVAGYVLPSRSIVLISPFAIQRDPRWFPEPDRFDPERWRAQEQANRPKYSYIPFGGGPRGCIGEAFARMEAVLVLAAIAQCHRLHVPEEYRPALLPLVTLRPKNGLPARAERR